MSTDVSITSAKIYQFPVGGRRAVARVREQSMPATEVPSPRVAVSGAWYHEAAIQDAKRASEH